jgi:hypothetical protein
VFGCNSVVRYPTLGNALTSAAKHVDLFRRKERRQCLRGDSSARNHTPARTDYASIISLRLRCGSLWLATTDEHPRSSLSFLPPFLAALVARPPVPRSGPASLLACPSLCTPADPPALAGASARSRLLRPSRGLHHTIRLRSPACAWGFVSATPGVGLRFGATFSPVSLFLSRLNVDGAEWPQGGRA